MKKKGYTSSEMMEERKESSKKGFPKKKSSLSSKIDSSLFEMTDQQIEEEYEGDDALISIKKFEKIKFLIQEGYKELEQFRGEDISVFVGNTRSGKSTVINVVLNNTLSVEIKKKRANISISEDEVGPQIGNESVSETKMPSRYESEDFGVIWDCPGYGDNRGDTQDIANNFYIKKLFESAKSVRVVVISDVNDVEKLGADGLISLTKSLDLSFGKNSKDGGGSVLEDLVKNKAIGMVVTKSDEDDEYVKDLYRDDFLKADGISKVPTADKLIGYFLKGSQMCVVPKIEKEHIGKGGVIDNEFLRHPVFSLFNSLGNLKIDSDFSIRPGLSPSAQKFIYTYYTDEGMVVEFKNFFDFIKSKSSSYMSLINEADKDVLKQLLENVDERIEFISKFCEDIERINSLQDIVLCLKDELPILLDPMTEGQSPEFVNYIETYFKDHDLIPQAVFLDFLAGSILKVNNSLLPIVQKFLSDLKSNYIGNMNDMRLLLGQIQEEEHMQKQQELLDERKAIEKSYKAELAAREEERVKQAENFAKQQKEDLEKHRAEQEKIRKEMNKYLQDEKEKNEKDLKQMNKEWQDMQKKMQEAFTQEVSGLTTRLGEMSVRYDALKNELDGQKHTTALALKRLEILKKRAARMNKQKKKLKLKGGQDQNYKELEDHQDMIVHKKMMDDSLGTLAILKRDEAKWNVLDAAGNLFNAEEKFLNALSDKGDIYKAKKDLEKAQNDKRLAEMNLEKFSFVNKLDYDSSLLKFTPKVQNVVTRDDQIPSEGDVIGKISDIMGIDHLKESLMKEMGEKLAPEVLNDFMTFCSNLSLDEYDRIVSLIKEINEKFGPEVLNNFVTLCSNLTLDEYYQIVSQGDVMDNICQIMGLNNKLISEALNGLTLSDDLIHEEDDQIALFNVLGNVDGVHEPAHLN